jgi:hypothetical protein
VGERGCLGAAQWRGLRSEPMDHPAQVVHQQVREVV